MAVISGTTYRFTNAQFPAKALNVYAANEISARRNVCLYEDTPSDIMQQWVVTGSESAGYIFKCKANHEYALRYSGNDTDSYAHNADVTSISTDTTKFLMEFEYLGNNKVRIKHLATGTYLTAWNGEDGNTNVITQDNFFASGNVFWMDLIYGDSEHTTTSDKQVWNISPSIDGDTSTEESDYSTGYYRFSNGGYYLTGTTNSVTAAAVNGQTTQTWNFSNNKLCTESSSSYGIAGTSSATMSTSPNSVVLVWAGTNKCYIKLSGSNKYLQRSSTTVSWGTSPTEWIVEEIIKKTGVPYLGTEYFSAMAGESNGSWNSTRTANLKLLFQKFYLNHSGSVSDARIGQNLYGALYSSAVPGKFHTGIDVNDGDAYNQYKIYSPIDGYIINCNTDNGAVCIYNEQQNFTIVLMHLQINSSIQNIASETLSSNNHITEGTLIGTQCGYSGGIYNAYASHLHFEFHDGRYTGNGAGLPSKSYDALGSTVNPYDKIAAIVS